MASSRSLRWRLQLWHAMVLILVMAGFGSILYWEVRKARMDEIDAELIAGARTLEGALRNAPPHLWEGIALPLGRADGLQLPPSIHHERPPWEPHSPSYFVIRRGSGEVLKAEPKRDSVPPPMPVRPGEVSRRNRGLLHEVAIIGPHRTQILVGRSIGWELGTIRRFLVRLVGIGLGVGILGLGGGWWLAGRAVRPIEEMSRTASGISAASLSKRIDLADVDRELGELGGILNAMLGRLEAAFEQQIRFTADASHELRTPLAVILANAELALNRPRSSEEYRETIETCLRAGMRMRTLVDDLLLLARADAGKLELRPRRCDLFAIAEDTASLLAPLTVDRGVTVSVTGDPVEVMADPDRMIQVVTNLVSNAIVYNRPSGTVTLTASLDGDRGVLTVSDTGQGIAEEDLPHLFERFYRADKARSRKAGGNGLGLSICKSIVEAHGGTISVVSEADKGTTFEVRLGSSSSVVME